jgi:hypothetical protein
MVSNSFSFIYDISPAVLSATTEHDIHLLLLKEEEADASRGILLLHAISPSSFLQMGLELEEQQ